MAKEKRRLNLIQERDSAIVGIQLQESIQESKVKASSLPRRDSFQVEEPAGILKTHARAESG